MSIKKMLLLASMALAAIAFAAPATASAEWTHEGEPIGDKANISLSGTVGFAGAGGAAFECVVHSSVTLEPGTTGTVKSFQITTNTCKGTGPLENCVLANDTVIGLPWVVHTNGTAMTITDVTITNHYVDNTPACPVHTTVLHFASATATPDSTSAMSSVTVSGTATSGAVAFGSFAVTPAGTYGI